MTFKSAFHSPADAWNGKGIRPVVFDIISPDGETSLLPDDIKLVLHVNPTSMNFAYSKTIERVQTLGGFVEYHWGEALGEITLEAATGGFMRLYAGAMATTGGPYAQDIGGTRRDTIAYDTYLNLRALFQNNGSVYDVNGNIAMQGRIRITFDGQSHVGVFTAFSMTEEAESPYSFKMSASFTIEHDSWTLRASHVDQPIEATFSQGAPRTTVQSPADSRATVVPAKVLAAPGRSSAVQVTGERTK